MATRVWTGAVDSTWNTAGNWDTGVPVSTDDVYIVSGSVDITGYDANAVTLGKLVVGNQYTGSIGSSGTKLQISATNFDYSGTGAGAYFEGTYTTLTVQDTGTNSTALNLYGDSDTITTLRVLGGSGTIVIDSSCSFASGAIEQIGADGVTLSIADSTTLTGATLTMDSGIVEMNQAVPTVTVFGGELKATLDGGTVTTLNQYGGKVRWKPTAACTLTTLTIYSGLFDCSDSTSSVFTIQNCTIHESGQLDERSGIENATYTNPISLGGEMFFDAGRSVTIS